MSWRRDEIELGQLFARDGVVYRVVALIDDPVVVLDPLDESAGRGRLHHVVRSPVFERFDRVVSESSTGAQNRSGKQSA